MKYVPCTILTHTVYRRGGGGGGCRSWYPEKCEGQGHGQASAPQTSKKAAGRKGAWKKDIRRRYGKRQKVEMKKREAESFFCLQKHRRACSRPSDMFVTKKF